MKENKIIISGITFHYEDLEITDDVMENINDFIKDLEESHDGIFDSFFYVRRWWQSNYLLTFNARVYSGILFSTIVYKNFNSIFLIFISFFQNFYHKLDFFIKL